MHEARKSGSSRSSPGKKPHQSSDRLRLRSVMLIFQGVVLPAGVGTAPEEAFAVTLSVAGCHWAVPYTRLDELARSAPCAVTKHNTRQIPASSIHERQLSTIVAHAD